MKEVTGDVWVYPANVICIPTNGHYGYQGSKARAVMGRGVAYQAKMRYPGLEYRVGKILEERGNDVHWIGKTSQGQALMTFPVKHHWREPADLELIEISAYVLAEVAEHYSDLLFVLPRPGCGNGQRIWDGEVKQLIEPILPNNVHVIDFA